MSLKENPPENKENSAELLKEALDLERQAQRFLIDQKHEQAYTVNCQAATIFDQIGKNEQAAFCFTQAASCWNKHIGQLPLSKAADAHEKAALAFLKADNYQYAMLRFSDAALLYEREGNYQKFSNCFYAAKCAEGQHAWQVVLHGKGLIGGFFEKLSQRFVEFIRWKMNWFNRLIWGYGEKPFRTFGVAALVIFFCAVIYDSCGPIHTQLGPRDIVFGEGLYLSMVTFATVGYGDFLPLSFISRFVAVIEAFSGIILMPLFLVGLTRKYLRTAH